MSGEDDDPEKKIKDNTAPELKPQNVRRQSRAPFGMMGNQHRAVQKNSLLSTGKEEKHLDQSRENLAENPQENSEPKSYAIRTGHDEIDAQSSKTDQLIDEKDLASLLNKGLEQEEAPPEQGLRAEFQKQSDLAGREFPEKQEIEAAEPARAVEAEPSKEPETDKDFMAREIQLMKEQEARESGDREQPTAEQVLFGSPQADNQSEQENVERSGPPTASVDAVAREIQLMKEQEAREKDEREQDTGRGR